MIWICQVKICPDGCTRTSLGAGVFQRAAVVSSGRLTVSARISMFEVTASHQVSQENLQFSLWRY